VTSTLPSEPRTYPEDSLTSIFRAILDNYASVKQESPHRHPFMNWFRRMGTILPRIIPALHEIEVEPGMGHSSNWSRNVYIQMRRPVLAPQRKSGVSLAYFFNVDLSGVYLSFYVGADSLPRLLSAARQEVISLREALPVSDRFHLDSIKLGPSVQAFEDGHLWGIKYDSNALPDEATLRSDLESLLKVYRDADQTRIETILTPQQHANVARPSSPKPNPAIAPYRMEDLIADTLWTRESLEEVLAALDPEAQVSRQVILAGPPGTGKTWIAKKLVYFVTQGDASRSWFVQFHPSYSYEQFVEGLRPIAKDGVITFETFPGVVLRSAQEAAARDERCYLIIDEINRANLPRVLGELMFLFEYRDEAIDLALTRGFKLPANLAFIGTMNTADRSIRSIDLALRRRFDIFECLPDADILDRFYSQAGHESTVEDLREGFVRLNDFLEKELDRYHTIGHTFFMAPLFTADTLVRVWKRQIFPTLAEYFFDQPEQLEALVPERFWPSIA
jgi:hypothetical protein